MAILRFPGWPHPFTFLHNINSGGLPGQRCMQAWAGCMNLFLAWLLQAESISARYIKAPRPEWSCLQLLYCRYLCAVRQRSHCHSIVSPAHWLTLKGWLGMRVSTSTFSSVSFMRLGFTTPMSALEHHIKSSWRCLTQHQICLWFIPKTVDRTVKSTHTDYMTIPSQALMWLMAEMFQINGTQGTSAKTP